MNNLVPFQGLRDTFFYYPPGPKQEEGVNAMRYKQYKLHFYTSGFVCVCGCVCGCVCVYVCVFVWGKVVLADTYYVDDIAC